MVVPIISERYVKGGAIEVLRWSHQAKKVLQPVVHARHKTKIGDWIGKLPPFAGKLDWIDLSPEDDDYLHCAIKKILEAAKELTLLRVLSQIYVCYVYQYFRSSHTLGASQQGAGRATRL